ncbi:PcfJ domain-containing protein [Pararhizobium sp. BT-229]|uniref:PcfJ domain-containing protein n=1 Tax=Pararhizobium sp. BT-229 TaxID=2986923 RepID=UPI0021F7592B|nr:PcfJ domain-containing protein [Pararhizobium sp. BT-229]MCV9963663.1 PcfJ domain-containing protein [Pararhizobium sp. BT-229]
MKKELSPEIAGFLRGLTDDAKVLRLLEHSVGRVLDNATTRGVEPLSLIDRQQAAHITDWLAAAVENDDPWLKATDLQGRPRKLMKFGSIEAIVSEADKAMRIFLQRNGTVKLREGDEELYAELSDGFHVVRLLTPEALDRESGEMQHCVGQGAYDHKVATEHYEYLSLRDRFGKAHVTIELDLRPARGPIIIQCQGKQNEPPSVAYATMLGPMFRERGIRVGQIGEIVYDQNWAAHHLPAMPSGIVVRGSMDVRNIHDLRLPEKMTVHGDFNCEGCHEMVLPMELSVSGGLFMSMGSVRKPAECISVGQDLGLVRMKTPDIGIASMIRARRFRAASLADWTTVEQIDADAVIVENCGVDTSEALLARDRTRAARMAEAQRLPKPPTF